MSIDPTDNPFQPPSANTSVVDAARLGYRIPSWRATLLLGVLAGVVSLVLGFVSVVLTSNPTTGDLALLGRELRAACFYSAGAVLALGFTLSCDRRSAPQGMISAVFLGYLALFAAELIAKFALQTRILDRSLAFSLNLALRSAFLIFVVCWRLDANRPFLWMLVPVFVGTFLSLMLTWFMGSSISWSVVAAVQIRLALSHGTQQPTENESSRLYER